MNGLVARAALPHILVVEDHPMMVRSITASLETLHPSGHPGRRILTVGSLAQAKRSLLRPARPDLVIADLNLPDSAGLDTLSALVTAAPGVPIIVFSATDDKTTAQAVLEMGARAFVPKSAMPQNFAQQIRPYLVALSQFDGSNPRASIDTAVIEALHPIELLSDRQREVLIEVAQGYKDNEIATRLNVSLPTVRSHLMAIFERLGVKNRTQASMKYIAWAKANGLVA